MNDLRPGHHRCSRRPLLHTPRRVGQNWVGMDTCCYDDCLEVVTSVVTATLTTTMLLPACRPVGPGFVAAVAALPTVLSSGVAEAVAPVLKPVEALATPSITE